MPTDGEFAPHFTFTWPEVVSPKSGVGAPETFLFQDILGTAMVVLVVPKVVLDQGNWEDDIPKIPGDPENGHNP